MSSIGIVGTGWVGSSVAISLLHTGVAEELLLHDSRPALAEGEAMDLAHGAAFYPACRVRAASIEQMHDAQAIVIAAGKGGGPSQSRLDLLRDNAEIIRDLGQALQSYAGIVVIVTNPVDVLTHLFQSVSGLPAERVIGTGTMLDTARLRQILGRELSIDPHSTHAQVIGEHGDSGVVLWSSARIGGRAVRDWPGWNPEQEERIAHEVRRAAYEIIQRKGATNHAIGLVTASLLESILRNERRVLTVTRTQCGAGGLRDLALSLPAVVAEGGALQVLEPELDEPERDALGRSAEILRRALSSVV